MGRIRQISTHLQPQHGITLAVAAATLGVAVAGGGSSALAYSSASLALWAAILVGVAGGWFPRTEPPPGAILAGACITGLVALIGVSILWASDDGAAFEDLVRALTYLGLFVLVVVASRRGEATAWLRGLAIGLVLTCVLALGARFEPSLFGDGDLDFNAQLSEGLSAAKGRLSYPIGYWNGLAAAMAICGVLLGWLGARAETRLGRALAVGLLALPPVAIYAAESDGGFIAMGFGLVVLFAALQHRFSLLAGLAIGGAGGFLAVVLARQRQELLSDPGGPLAGSQGTEMLVLSIVVVLAAGLIRFALDRPIESFRPSRRFATGASVTAVVLVVIALFAFDVNVDPVDRWEEFKRVPNRTDSTAGNFLTGSSSGRYQYWTTALDAFQEEPLRGIGSSDFEPYWNRNGTLPVTIREAHSLFIESAAELGIGGVVFSVGLFVVAGFTGSRRRGMLGGPPRGAVAAALGVLAAGFGAASGEWVWNLPAVFGPVIVAAALLTGAATLPALAPRVPAPMAFMRSRRRFAGGVAVLLVAWAAICAAGLLLLAQRALDDSIEAFVHNDPQDALAQAAEANQLEPWAAEPYGVMAQVYRATGDIPSAQAAVGEAIERSPQQWRLWILAAQLDISANDIAGARLNFDRAYELAPNLKPGSERYFRGLVEQE